jgi:hypothetical protein
VLAQIFPLEIIFLLCQNQIGKKLAKEIVDLGIRVVSFIKNKEISKSNLETLGKL